MKRKGKTHTFMAVTPKFHSFIKIEAAKRGKTMLGFQEEITQKRKKKKGEEFDIEVFDW